MGERADRLPLPGAPGVEVELRRSAGARRLSLRVSRIDGRVTLSLPRGARAETVQAFLETKADWVLGHLSRQPAQRVPQVGGTVPIGGIETPIVAGRASGNRSGAVAVNPARPVPPQVAGVLKALARDRLAASCDAHAAALARPYTAIALRDTRSRWGSCSSAGRLMFSWRLAMAPSAVLDYVAAHEVAHLAEMSHAPAFWRHVARLCPEYRTHRTWLRRHGTDLHAIRFEA